ncbi:MAG: Uma2 family endonuclease [Gammaproteobacteria bacterium]|nr:Uma2 family endonuclease [Gammaproteobacteria bacterium]
MPTAQSIPSEYLHRHRITVEDYYKIGEAGIFSEKDKVELIEGEIIDMVPIGSQHAYILNKLNRVFTRQAPDNTLVRIQDPLRLDKYNEPEPDLALVTNNDYSKHHPCPSDTLLVIEVADSSLTYDSKVKIPLYARHNIPQVWLVNVSDRIVHVFQQPENGEYQLKDDTQFGKLSPSQLSSIILDLDILWSS